MKTITKTYTVYSFDELSESAKEKAIANLSEINFYDEWWSGIYEDAEQIGLNLLEFDIDSASFVQNLTGEFITSAGEVVENILINHGKECNTYKLAYRYKNAFQLNSREESDEILSDREDLFLRELIAEYKALLQQDIEYKYSKEAIIETIKENDYEFTEDGKQFY